jgi:hypothetical protein
MVSYLPGPGMREPLYIAQSTSFLELPVLNFPPEILLARESASFTWYCPGPGTCKKSKLSWSQEKLQTTTSSDLVFMSIEVCLNLHGDDIFQLYSQKYGHVNETLHPRITCTVGYLKKSAVPHIPTLDARKMAHSMSDFVLLVLNLPPEGTSSELEPYCPGAGICHLHKICQFRCNRQRRLRQSHGHNVHILTSIFGSWSR